jgi:hypothetical protein
LVCQWIASIGLDPSFFGTHSLRRTKATLIYPPRGQSAGSTASVGTQEDREHGALPRH